MYRCCCLSLSFIMLSYRTDTIISTSWARSISAPPRFSLDVDRRSLTQWRQILGYGGGNSTLTVICTSTCDYDRDTSYLQLLISYYRCGGGTYIWYIFTYVLSSRYLSPHHAKALNCVLTIRLHHNTHLPTSRQQWSQQHISQKRPILESKKTLMQTHASTTFCYA